MDATSDDLLKPLGVERRDAGRGRVRVPVRVLAACLALAVSAVGAVLAITATPPAREPANVTAAETRVAAQTAAPNAEPGQAARIREVPPDNARHTAAELETASGVSVVRPAGGTAPAALVIRIPDAPTAALDPAPDPRLVEAGRHGLLPKIGEDGARALRVYARPAGALAGGARPVARIAILVGGLGISEGATAAAIAGLPAAVSLALAPYGRDLAATAAQARDAGHEIMLQMPMESLDEPGSDAVPHTLKADAKPAENVDRLHWAMSRFSGYTGLVNVLGAKVTADEAALTPILREIGGRGLAFLDDGSSARSRVGTVGRKVRTPIARADLVLDRAADTDAIDRELGRLEEIARQRGFAIGVASALPASIERLARWTRPLAERGILLVPVSDAFGRAERP